MKGRLKFMLGSLIGLSMIATPFLILGQERMQPNQRSRNVIINRVPLTQQQITFLEQRFNSRVQDGAYWYDRVSGAWGLEGGPTVAIGIAGLNMGGPLRADASRGNTGVFINGRELHMMDVAALQQLGPVYRGRYWVDAAGNCGIEGGPPLLNLYAAARAKSQSRGEGFSVYGRHSSMVSDGQSVFISDGSGKSTSWSR